MEPDEIMSTIHSRLSPVEVRKWFLAAGPEIQDEVVALTRADGLDEAVKEVNRLYLAWLELPRP
jgi:hypothetical protein